MACDEPPRSRAPTAPALAPVTAVLTVNLADVEPLWICMMLGQDEEEDESEKDETREDADDTASSCRAATGRHLR